MAATLDYYLALSSPWTYLAGPRFAALVERNRLAVSFKPYDIMHVFQRNGTKPVGQRPKPVQANRLNELTRWQKHLDMPLNLQPAHFPVDPTLAGRLLIAAQEAGAGHEKTMALSFACLRACWVAERDLSDEPTLVAIAGSCGLDGEALLAAAKGEASAAVFERNTEDAIANDVFGSPTWIHEGELFWGQDRLDFLARAVEGGA